MSKRLIVTLILGVLLALLCLKFMSDGRSPSLAYRPNSTSSAGMKPPMKSPTSRVEPTAPPEAVIGAKPHMKLANQLVAGGRQWKLNFADQALPDEVRKRICYDLSLVLGHLPGTVIDTLPLPIEVDGRQLDRRVRFEGEGRKWNKALQSDEFGCLFRGASESELYVPRAVIDAYRKAIELETQNQAAYQQLDQFLGRMTELKGRPIENVRELFVVADDFKSAEADLAAMPAAGFAEGWGGKHYREASVLDVTTAIGTPFEKYGSLVATTYAVSSGKLNDLPPLVYSNGQWRFLLQRPPT